MDDIKSKFLDFINYQGQPKIPIVGGSIEDLTNEEDCSQDLNPVKSSENERPSDQEILETIDLSFFNTDDSYDARRNELNKHEDFSDISKLQSELKLLQQQHFVVSNHVLQMILEKQSVCEEEFNRIVEIQKELDILLKSVKNSRDYLSAAKNNFTTTSLGILANYRKRTLITQVLSSLNTIKNLHKTESKMSRLLSAGDFPRAITLLLECSSIAAMHKHFLCVTGLCGKLQDALEMTEEHLDVALAKICYGFDETIYRKLQSAYGLLEKTQIAMDQLHMHFTSAVHSTASNVVNYFIGEIKTNVADINFSQFYKINVDSDNYINKTDFPELCKCVSEENFIPCLLLLCKSLWCIILSYFQVVHWHQNNPLSNEGSSTEACYSEQTMKQKLNCGLIRLWHDVQMRVSTLVLSVNLSNYKFDDFLQILAILHRLSQIGEELCGSGSEEVASSIKKQSSVYFKTYHAAKLDDLKVFLENEAWTPCPVRSDFSVLHLQEFRGLRYNLEQCAGADSKHNTSVESSSGDSNFFSRYQHPSKATPFDINFEIDSNKEEILSAVGDEPSSYFSEESEEEVELQSTSTKSRREAVGRKEAANGLPLLTNTTVSVLRLCGKYLQMSKYLKPIASQVVSALTQLFDFYLYTVHLFFATNFPNTLSLNVSSLKLQAVLNRIRDSLIIENENIEEHDLKVFEAQISPLVDLTSPDTLFGLLERIVGVESLLFLSREFIYLKPYLEQLLQSQGSTLHNLQQFYNQTIEASFEVRKPVYACVAWRAINEKYVLDMMYKVNWEVNDIVCEHSSYVDYLSGEVQNFSKLLDNLSNLIVIQDEVYNSLWDNLIFLISKILVEGFSSARKCSTGGRALMQLDFIQLFGKLEKICNLRPLPHKDLVEVYIKAYYLSEENLDSWIKNHREYTSKQLLALVSSICQNNKKARQKLNTLIDELEKSGVR